VAKEIRSRNDILFGFSVTQASRFAEKLKFCHFEARRAPRNLSFPALKPKRDSSVAAATSE